MRMNAPHKPPKSARRATNVSLDSAYLAEARELGINISQACERGLAETLAEVRAQRWLEENREALESSNDYVRKNGLPLAHLRLF
jgi:antitoxin CcdA